MRREGAVAAVGAVARRPRVAVLSVGVDPPVESPLFLGRAEAPDGFLESTLVVLSPFSTDVSARWRPFLTLWPKILGLATTPGPGRVPQHPVAWTCREATEPGSRLRPTLLQRPRIAPDHRRSRRITARALRPTHQAATSLPRRTAASRHEECFAPARPTGAGRHGIRWRQPPQRPEAPNRRLGLGTHEPVRTIHPGSFPNALLTGPGSLCPLRQRKTLWREGGCADESCTAWTKSSRGSLNRGGSGPCR